MTLLTLFHHRADQRSNKPKHAFECKGYIEKTEVQLRLVENTVRMTQAEMSELFDISRSGTSEHLKSIFNTGELNRDKVVRKFRKEPGHPGQGRTLEHYNLGAIMVVGFRDRGPAWIGN